MGLALHAKTPINNFPDFCYFVPRHPIGMLASVRRLTVHVYPHPYESHLIVATATATNIYIYISSILVRYSPTSCINTQER